MANGGGEILSKEWRSNGEKRNSSHTFEYLKNEREISFFHLEQIIWLQINEFVGGGEEEEEEEPSGVSNLAEERNQEIRNFLSVSFSWILPDFKKNGFPSEEDYHAFAHSNKPCWSLLQLSRGDGLYNRSSENSSRKGEYQMLFYLSIYFCLEGEKWQIERRMTSVRRK